MAKKRKRKKSVKFKIKSIMKIFFLIIFLSAVVFGVYKNENINMNNFFRKYIKVQLPMSLKIEIEKAKIVLKNIEKLIPMDNEEYKVIYVSDGDTISVKKLEKGIITGKLIKVYETNDKIYVEFLILKMFDVKNRCLSMLTNKSNQFDSTRIFRINFRSNFLCLEKLMHFVLKFSRNTLCTMISQCKNVKFRFQSMMDVDRDMFSKDK